VKLRGDADAAVRPVFLRAAPDRQGRLSDGVLLEASVLGRVLGIRLLTIRATVVLAPASVSAAPADGHPPAPVEARRSAATPPPRRRAPRRELAEAVRRMDEGAELLAEARRHAV